MNCRWLRPNEIHCTFLFDESSSILETLNPIHLYLIIEKSSLEYQVRQTRILVYFELDFVLPV